MGSYLKRRLMEASTWRGVVLVLTALGVQISPELGQAIVTAGLAVAGVIGLALPD